MNDDFNLLVYILNLTVLPFSAIIFKTVLNMFFLYLCSSKKFQAITTKMFPAMK